MKKVTLCVSAALICCVLVLAACGKSAHEHKFGDWYDTKEPTCVKYGERMRKCDCGETETEKIPPYYAHYFEDGVCESCGAAEATEGLTYALTADGDGYELTDVPSGLTEAVVDNVHDGKPVIGIAAGAFKNKQAPQNVPQNNTALELAVLNEGISYIGGGAFYKCTSLNSVVLPSSLERIGANAFYGCEKLAAATLPDGLKELGTGAFQRCAALKSVVLPSSLETVGASAFQGCAVLTEIDLGGVKYLGASAFYGCSCLASAELAHSRIVSVLPYTFYGCGALESIVLPDTLTVIGSSAFAGCTRLGEVIMPAGVTVAPDAFSGTLVC